MKRRGDTVKGAAVCALLLLLYIAEQSFTIH